MDAEGIKRITGLPDAEARFECYWCTAEKSGDASPKRKEFYRDACKMSQAEFHWLEDRAKEIHADMLAKSANGNGSNKELKALDDELQRLNGRCGTWRIGEAIRQRRLWIEAAEDWARERISGRRAGNETLGFDAVAFTVDGCERVSCDGPEARKRLEHAARWLPVYYEYARQSPRWLAWVRMIRTAKDGDMNQYAEINNRMDGLKATLGKGWLCVFKAMSEWLGEDLPFSEVPSNRRRDMAIFAAEATLTDVEIDPQTVTILDAGRPSCPPEAKWAGRQYVRLASLEESTQTTSHAICDLDTKEVTPCQCRNVLNATVAESFHKPHEGKWEILKSEIRRRGNNDLSARAVKDEGAEVLVLHVNWRDTSNTELGKAFASLCGRIRPAKWPALEESSGDSEQSANKALAVLMWWRMTEAIKAPVSESGLVGDAKAFLKQRQAFKAALQSKRRGLGVNVPRAKARAAEWFKEITGDDEAPWWIGERVSNRK